MVWVAEKRPKKACLKPCSCRNTKWSAIMRKNMSKSSHKESSCNYQVSFFKEPENVCSFFATQAQRMPSLQSKMYSHFNAAKLHSNSTSVGKLIKRRVQRQEETDLIAKMAFPRVFKKWIKWSTTGLCRNNKNLTLTRMGFVPLVSRPRDSSSVRSSATLSLSTSILESHKFTKLHQKSSKSLRRRIFRNVLIFIKVLLCEKKWVSGIELWNPGETWTANFRFSTARKVHSLFSALG